MGIVVWYRRMRAVGAYASSRGIRSDMWLDDIADWRRSEMAYHVQTTDDGSCEFFLLLSTLLGSFFYLGIRLE
jgi:hypothetical protein